MNVIQRIFWAHLAMAVLALALGYSLVGLWPAAVVIILLGGVWLIAQRRGANAIAMLLLYLFLFTAALGSFLGIPAVILALAAVATLGAWDLDHFLVRLNSVKRVDFETGIGRAHLRRLALVEGAGFVAALLAFSIHAGISFWWEALLALLAIIGIGEVVLYVRKQVED